MFEELKKFNFITYTSILYLSIADGMNNPDRLRKLYSKHVLIRYGYTLFGAYNVFGSEFGMNLGFKSAVLISAIMMILLDLGPKYLRTKEEHQKLPFTPLFSKNLESYIVMGLIVYLYTNKFN